MADAAANTDGGKPKKKRSLVRRIGPVLIYVGTIMMCLGFPAKVSHSTALGLGVGGIFVLLVGIYMSLPDPSDKRGGIIRRTVGGAALGAARGAATRAGLRQRPGEPLPPPVPPPKPEAFLQPQPQQPTAQAADGTGAAFGQPSMPARTLGAYLQQGGAQSQGGAAIHQAVHPTLMAQSY